MIDESIHLHVATILGAHGIRGQLRLKVFLDDPMSVGDFGPVLDMHGKEFDLQAENFTKGVVTAKAKGLRYRDQAEALKGLKLFLPLESLPPPEEDEFFPFELEGLKAVSDDGAPLGEVIRVVDYGAGDLLEIRLELSGKAELFAFTKQNFPSVDLEQELIVFRPPEESSADQPT